MTLKLDELIQKLPTSDSPYHSPSSSSTMSSPASPSLFHRIKLEVPRFNGIDPLGWIFKINQFFEYHSTPEIERLTISSFYMEGRGLAWFQWMTNNSQLTSWPTFLQVLQTCFAPSQYKDPIGALFKLTQRSIVNAYLSEFEDLVNWIIGLPPPFLLSFFISGLAPEIRHEV